MKSFRPKDGSGAPPGPGRDGERNDHGERRRNDTHASTTDPRARLLRKGKGKEARLCSIGHALTENRHGLRVDGRVSEASGTAERNQAALMIAGRAVTPPAAIRTCRNGSSLPVAVIASQPACRWPKQRLFARPPSLTAFVELRRSPRGPGRTSALYFFGRPCRRVRDPDAANKEAPPRSCPYPILSRPRPSS